VPGCGRSLQVVGRKHGQATEGGVVQFVNRVKYTSSDVYNYNYVLAAMISEGVVNGIKYQLILNAKKSTRSQEAWQRLR